MIKFELFKGVQKKTYDYAIIFSCNVDDKFEEIIEKQYIYFGYKDSNLAKILKFQKEQVDNGEPLKLLLIFDDVIGSINFNSPLIKMLITRYRHFNVGVVFSTQYLYMIPPPIRECCSKAFIFYQETKRSIDACYETYGGGFENSKQFRNYMIENTKDHHFIVCNSKNSEINGKYEKKKIDIKSIPKNTKIEF